MLKAPEWWTLELKKPLSTRTVKILIKIFSDRIYILWRIHKESSINNPNWLLWQPNFSQDESDKLNRLLKRFWLKLAKRYANVNSILCYREVWLHHDRQIPIWNGHKMKIDDCSYIFVPLYWHDWAIFTIWEEDKEKRIPICDGHVTVLDHNTIHGIQFPVTNNWLKYWLSFLADTTTPLPPSA